MKLKGLLIALAVLGIISLFNTSCKKNTDCIAVVQCMDSTGIGMPGVDVLLYANVKTTTGGTITADLRGNAVTDASGRVSFTFKLPAIYDIKATKKSASTTTATTGSTLTGVSIIKLEEGKTVEKIITVR
jgi:hypothetical protein